MEDAMRKFGIVVLMVLVIGTTLGASNQNLTGLWMSKDGKTTYEIIDGFKPNQGVVIATKKTDKWEIGSWECKGDTYTINMGWYPEEVTFESNDVMRCDRISFSRSNSIVDTDLISIKTDEEAFIEKLTEYEWLDGSKLQSTVFRKTFSNDSGVVEEFSNAGDLIDFESWGVASGVLKIDSKILIESRVSDQYFLGLDQYDNFVVYKKSKKAIEMETVDIKNQREVFLSALTTDAWFTKSYYSEPTIYRFRPVESELKGRTIVTRDTILTNWSVWEYSPNTGALKIGYYDYIGALLVGDTMAFIDNSGTQTFYRRLPGGPNYQFTVADVTSVPLSETNVDKVIKILDGQFNYSDYIYAFEFSENKINGFVHKFQSLPFSITGNTFKNSLLGSSKQLWAVDDVVIFDESTLFQRDSRKVRLGPLSDEEASAIKVQNEAKAKSSAEKNVMVKVRTKDNKTYEVALPISDFSQIADLSLVVE
jgi:hypothetical protein